MSVCLHQLVGRGVLRSIDFHFAMGLARMGGEQNSDVLLAAALASSYLGRGHICFDIFGAHPDELRGDSEVAGIPSGQKWFEALAASDLVSDGASSRPLVLCADGRLYLRRYWAHEQALTRYLRARSVELDDSVRVPELKSGLERLFPVDTNKSDVNGATALEAVNYQRLAAVIAVRRRFCVISGGPGTGKTHTVVNILALLIEQALLAKNELPKITLVAPTGKAASRLMESIRRSKVGLKCSDEVRAGIPDVASTLHRCLGSVRGSSTVFRHNRENRLLTDVMLVDEASMVNLGLMRRLTDALRDSARLILLGDMNQLSSVEAGAVLGDIGNFGGTRSISASFANDVEQISGDKISVESNAPTKTGIWDCVVTLEKSYRFGADSGIAELADAINQGDAQRALAACFRYAELRFVPHEADGTPSSQLFESVADGYGEYLRGGSCDERLQRFDSFRVLCPRRTGNFGVAAINAQIESSLFRKGLLVPDREYYPGRPILITANNYELGVYNGDVGLILEDEELKSQEVFAHFLGVDGRVRKLSPSQLGQSQTVFAMSVHKSQGTEFSRVVIVLPDTPSRIMTREIIYTAVTRAKHEVEIYGSPEIFQHAIETSTVRRSGLRASLWNQSYSI